MTNQRFVVQLDRHTVGIAVRVPGGFMFYASDHAFDEMDGRVFSRARANERELNKVAKRQQRAAQSRRASPMPAWL